LRCEVCGCRIGGKPFNVIIEGARLTVCGECAKHGKICYDEPKPKLTFAKPKARPVMLRAQPKPKPPSVDTSLELVEDYGVKIRKAREQLGLSHEELGKKISEKESVLRKIETRKMAPNNLLITKLEHALKIKLLVPISEEKIPQIPKSPNRELTLGDLMQLNKKVGEEPTERKPS
jgi:putative transcription factor